MTEFSEVCLTALDTKITHLDDASAPLGE
jgi:hypothetical protein